MPKPLILKRPWIILDEVSDHNKIYILRHKEAEYQHFGIAIADIIRHTAKAFNIREEQLLKIVLNELVCSTDIPRESN